ncbi:MAG: exo-alpha-sialidase [Thermoleophilia bacterium]|nr:exo-alpha-sialidase [Thermoleophilia bacterium]
MLAAVATAEGVYLVDLEAEEVVDFEAGGSVAAAELELSLPRVVSAAAAGSTVVAVVERRPPLVVSHDAGMTWHEAGGGLPPGRAVAISPEHPDVVVYAARNRLYLSRDGGRFWQALTPELPLIEGVEVRAV